MNMMRQAWNFLGLDHRPLAPHNIETYTVTRGVRSCDHECAVCLCGFDDPAGGGGDGIVRELKNCGHVFHGACLERWIGYGHWTCPCCRNHVRIKQLGSADYVEQQVLVFDFGYVGDGDHKTSWWLR